MITYKNSKLNISIVKFQPGSGQWSLVPGDEMMFTL